MASGDYSIVAEGESGGLCECCGNRTRRVWGWAETDERTIGAFFVTWTVGMPQHGARIELVIGSWGEGATPNDRSWTAIDYGLADGSASFCVRDADEKLAAIATNPLRRNDVIGTPLAGQCFDLLDAIWLGDQRLKEIVDWT